MRIYLILGAVSVSVTATPLHARELAGGELKFNAGASVTNSSNVAYLTDTGVSESDDTSFAVTLGADYGRGIGQQGKLALSYDWSSTRYDDLDSRDSDLQIASAVYTHQVGVATVGGSYAEAWYDLNGVSLLNLSNTSAFIGAPGPFGLTLVGRYTYTDKAFDSGLESRDANTKTVGLTAQRRFGATTVRVGYAVANENSVSDTLDYDSGTFSASVSHPFVIASQPLNVTLRGSYSERDFDNLNPNIGVAREDERTRYGLSVSRSLFSGVSLSASLSRTASNSNLPAADYDQTVASLSLQATF